MADARENGTIVIFENLPAIYNQIIDLLPDNPHLIIKTFEDAVQFLINQWDYLLTQELSDEERFGFVVAAFVVGGNFSENNRDSMNGKVIIDIIRSIEKYSDVPVIDNGVATGLTYVDFHLNSDFTRIEEVKTLIKDGRHSKRDSKRK